ncbi:hypothetical protein AB0M36_02750 [Actinoplanes sp. NPDC051346]|uniref:hypothetical protein n=1 Tax=Actinoplanes sp. NPDC051346 TaxID=3155048 RepID=UPI00343B7481
MTTAENEMPEPKTPRKARTVLVITLCAVLGICFGAGSGIIGGHQAARLTAPDPLGPTALPAIPEKVPTGADEYLPGLRVSFITKNFLQKAKWTCETEATNDRYFPVAAYLTTCSAPNYVRLSVNLWHDDEAKVKLVETDCSYPLGSSLCRTLARGVAELTVVGQPEVAKRTAAWAADNVDRDATTVIGDVRLTADLSYRTPRMRIVPAK